MMQPRYSELVTYLLECVNYSVVKSTELQYLSKITSNTRKSYLSKSKSTCTKFYLSKSKKYQHLKFTLEVKSKSTMTVPMTSTPARGVRIPVFVGRRNAMRMWHSAIPSTAVLFHGKFQYRPSLLST